MTPNFPALLASITRCNAVYEPDDAIARRAFSLLGCVVLDRYCTSTAQAVAHMAPDGVQTLTISGTRVSEGPFASRFWDVFQDAEEVFSDHDLGGGAIVASGAYQRGTELWRWASRLFDPCHPIRIEGHSLGGQTAHAMLAIAPPDRLGELLAWEPPKAGNDQFWAQYGGHLAEVTTVLHGADPWAAHPWISASLFHPPGPILWLPNAGGWQWTTRDAWPGPSAIHATDHDTDQVMRAVSRLCV